MKKLSNIFIVVVLVSIFTAFTSAVPITRFPGNPEKINPALNQPGPASADVKLSYKELKSIAVAYKGDKLTLKEKISIRLFGKKIPGKLSSTPEVSAGKSHRAATLYCLFFGKLGIHRFYLGYTWQGVVQMLTLGGFGIWTMIDFIRLLKGNLQPKKSHYKQNV